MNYDLMKTRLGAGTNLMIIQTKMPLTFDNNNFVVVVTITFSKVSYELVPQTLSLIIIKWFAFKSQL